MKVRTEPDAIPGRAVLALLVLQLAAAIGLPVVGTGGEARRARATDRNRALVRELEITDLALWSEASYCRHPTQADLFAPFADHPAAFEHFPAGSIVPPPEAAGARRGGRGLAGGR